MKANARMKPGKRRGAVVLETGLVIGLMAMMLFGIFEYSRLLMDWSLLNNAAREGCRFALVNNTSPTVASNVESRVISYMSGETASFTGLSVTLTGSHEGLATPVVNLSPGDPITVTVSGQYKFLNIIPFVQMPTSFTISSAVTMLCEGGT